VICIGNFTTGGGGKTPTAIAVAALLAELGARPAFLTRGYGGTSEGPVLVAKGQSAGEVGDEPPLLAEGPPTEGPGDREAGGGAVEVADGLAALGVPDLGKAVGIAHRHVLAVGGPGEGGDVVVALGGQQLLDVAAGGVPQVHRLVEGDGDLEWGAGRGGARRRVSSRVIRGMQLVCCAWLAGLKSG